MAIAYIDPLTNEPIEKERWRWVAIYTDKSELHQFAIENNKAIFHKFADIEQARIKKFMLVHDSYKPIIIRPPEGAKLIHGYVTGVHQYPLADGEHTATEKHRGYKFGYELAGHQHGVLVDYDDSILIIDDFPSAAVARDKIESQNPAG